MSRFGAYQYMMLAESYLSYPLKKEKEGVLLDIKFEKKFS